MTPQDTLIAQASALLDDVQHQRAKLAVYATPGQPQAGGLSAGQLRGRLSTQERKLETLIGNASNGGAFAEMRKDYQEISRECRDLFGEALAVLIAPTVRPLSNGACDVVEKLLRGLGQLVGVPWLHLTTLADSEFFGTASQVIRLRYPSSTVWDFPVAAHEFGHFVGPGWPTPDAKRNGYQDFLTETNIGDESYLQEYFADLFATFVLGPAFVNSCLLHRFDPVREEGQFHPSDRQRAVGILAALEMLANDSQPQTAPVLRRMHQMRTEEWNHAVAASGAVPVDDEFSGRLQGCLRTLWESLREWCGDAAFNDIHVSFRLRPERGEDVPSGATIRDVLNAAWIVRLEKPIDLLQPVGRMTHVTEIGRIDAWARTLCMGVPE
jgi:hypothetical protein